MDEPAQAVSVRRRRSRAQVRELVAAYSTSGLTQTEFCRRHAISLSTLQRYLSRQRDAQPHAAGVNLIAVEVNGGRRSERAPDDSGLAITLAAGRRIEVARGFDTQTLAQLLGVLERF